MQLSSSFLAAALVAAISSTACTETGDGLDDGDLATDLQALDGQSPGALIPQQGALGRAVYQRLARDWFRWAIEIPAANHPIVDPTGAACATHQSGPVWFLAGTFGGEATRACEIPFGKVVFVPLLNNFAALPPQYVTELEDLGFWDDLIGGYLDDSRAATCRLDLKLDGHAIYATTAERDQKLYAQAPAPFDIEIPEDGILGGPDGAGPALGWVGGQWALLALAPGRHTLEIGGAQCDAGEPYFDVHVTYNLRVR